MSFARALAVALAVAGPLAAGCQYVPIVPKSQLESAKAQNRTLCEQSRAQLAEIENLKVHKRNVEDQLIHAEEDLAKLDAEVGRDRQKLANFKTERARLKSQAGGISTGGNAIPPDLSGRLAELAYRYPSLQYDPKTGISKLDTDVLFDSGETDLKPGAEKLLGEFAQIFQAPEARELKIMVVGHTDTRGIKGREARAKYPTNWHLSASRALSVADRLREAGMPEDRMGVAGFGQHQPISPNDTAESRQKNRRVEIFVVGPETPVVGWTETLGTVYR
jgi:chemotaxis protein MotB